MKGIMNNAIVKIIKEKLEGCGGQASVPLLRGNRNFQVRLVDNGVEVSNLRSYPFLPWEVFIKTIELLDKNNGVAKKGNGRGSDKLGDGAVALDTIEGYIAREVYGKNIGESVFRRITPICNILIWAGVCENGKGTLKKI